MKKHLGIHIDCPYGNFILRVSNGGVVTEIPVKNIDDLKKRLCEIIDDKYFTGAKYD
jgi:hypothetical protein